MVGTVVGTVVGTTVEVLRVLSRQYVVVNVMVVVVPPVVQMDVPVEVIVTLELEAVLALADEVIETGVLVEEATEVLDAMEEDGVAVGVQLGRVKDSPQLPVAHSTMQFFSQAASPLVELVCQHSEPSVSPTGK